MEVHLKIIYSYGGMFKKVQRPQVLDSLFKGCSQMMALLWWLVPLKAHILCWAMFVFLLCKFCERKNEYSGTWRVPHMWWEREREGGEVKRERGEETEKGGRKKEKGRERSKKQATCYPQCLLRAVEYTCVRFRVKVSSNLIAVCAVCMVRFEAFLKHLKSSRHPQRKKGKNKTSIAFS